MQRLHRPWLLRLALGWLLVAWLAPMLGQVLAAPSGRFLVDVCRAQGPNAQAERFGAPDDGPRSAHSLLEHCALCAPGGLGLGLPPGPLRVAAPDLRFAHALLEACRTPGAALDGWPQARAPPSID